MSVGPDEPISSPRTDLADAMAWTGLGVAVLAGSWTMDRLENQDVPPFAAPGLLPLDAERINRVVGFLGVEATTSLAIRVLSTDPASASARQDG